MDFDRNDKFFSCKIFFYHFYHINPDFLSLTSLLYNLFFLSLWLEMYKRKPLLVKGFHNLKLQLQQWFFSFFLSLYVFQISGGGKRNHFFVFITQKPSVFLHSELTSTKVQWKAHYYRNVLIKDIFLLVNPPEKSAAGFVQNTTIV